MKTLSAVDTDDLLKRSINHVWPVQNLLSLLQTIEQKNWHVLGKYSGIVFKVLHLSNVPSSYTWQAFAALCIVTNALAHWTDSQVTKKMDCFEYGPCTLPYSSRGLITEINGFVNIDVRPMKTLLTSTTSS